MADQPKSSRDDVRRPVEDEELRGIAEDDADEFDVDAEDMDMDLDKDRDQDEEEDEEGTAF